MRRKKLIANCSLILFFALAGCKDDKKEVASPACSNLATASNSLECPRSDANIIRPKPKSWSFGDKSQ